MKLNEIRDISDYRSGDENDPRSPYYEDPFPNGIPDSFYPEIPTFDAKVESGKAPNGEDYNFIVVSSYDESDKEQYAIWEHALNEIAGDKRFEQSELVDQTEQRQGKKVAWTDYYLTGRGFPANDVVPTLNKIANAYAGELAERNAYDTVARDGRDWDRPADY